MFDAFKSALFGAGASFAIPDAFSLDDLASLSRKVRDERVARSERCRTDRRPSGDVGFDPDQIDAITRALTEQEKARPGLLRPPEHRRVAARANALLEAEAEAQKQKHIPPTSETLASALQTSRRRFSTPPCLRW